MGQTGGLYVDGRAAYVRRSWMQFELAPALPPQAIWSNVVKATLSVYAKNVIVPGNLQVSGAKKEWNEATLSDLTAPALSNNPDTGKAYATAAVTGSAKWVSFDVTELVRDWMDGTLPNNGFVLSAADGSLIVLLESKETASGNHAELEIVTGSLGQQGPQGIAGPQGSAGPQGPFGSPGKAGEPGVQGPQGVAGANGQQGAAGERGPTGERGPAGTEGTGVRRVNPVGDIAMGAFTQGEKP